jgi:hypothetical protein
LSAAVSLSTASLTAALSVSFFTIGTITTCAAQQQQQPQESRQQ